MMIKVLYMISMIYTLLALSEAQLLSFYLYNQGRTALKQCLFYRFLLEPLLEKITEVHPATLVPHIVMNN